MKNLLRVVALFVVVVLVASGCSYSEEAEPGVRNLALGTTPERVKPDLSDDCERSYFSVSWGCLNESEQQRAAGLLNTLNVLTSFEGTPSYVEDFYRRTEVLRLLIDFEALEVLCYTLVFESMVEEDRWPVSEDDFNHYLLSQLVLIREWIGGELSKVEARGTGETPVLETVRYRHLCPSWILEP